MTVRSLLPLATPFIAFIAAWVALATYRANSKTRRAEFLSALHRDFFVSEQYKPVRTLLDDDSPDAEAKNAGLVADESSAFTDFLNFFEFVAYLQAAGVLRFKDVEAMLGYYLRLLHRSPAIRGYIARPSKDFQYLRRLLGKLKPRHA